MKKFFYRVNAFDTIFSISEKFRVPIGVLIFDNNLKQEVSEGDVLFISIPDGKKYHPTPLDDYKSVAEKINLSEDYLKEKNKAPYLFYGAWILI